MVELRKRNDNNVGFVEPYVVYKYPQPPRDYKPEQEKNILIFLVNQHNKDMLFPYNFK